MVLPPSRSSEERSHEDHHFYSDRLVRSCRHRSARERLRREELLRPAGASLLLTPKTGWGGVSHRQPDDPLKRRGTAMKVLVSVAVYGLLPIPPMGVSSKGQPMRCRQVILPPPRSKAQPLGDWHSTRVHILALAIVMAGLAAPFVMLSIQHDSALPML